MKILMCNSFYYMRAGAERYMFELTKLLEKHGHEVIPFGMTHEKNFPTKYSNYFISYIDYPSLLKARPSLSKTIRAVGRVIYSNEAKKRIEQLIRDTKPDIAHIHGIGHEISASILDAIKSFDVPIVQTLHDYGLLCPNTSFISRGEVCERCKGQRYYNIVIRRCKRDSLGASLLACVSHYINSWTNIYGRNVDVYISPSKFLQQKQLEHGVDKKTVVIPNFINLDDCQPAENGTGYCLFAGRLMPMKGLKTLLEAAKLNRQARILIAGDGELAGEIRNTIDEYRLENVTLLGFVEPKELLRLMSLSNFTVFPSEWYENHPMSIIESFACGKPVIASNIGALPDLVKDGWSGLLFEAGNPNQLARQIQYLFDHPEKAAEMGRNGRSSLLKINDPEIHYQQIMAVYQSLLHHSAM
ncbi:MAG: glycosyltransferase family 4 protein [Anaerolineales bacterium]|nr:glycosyltransferase family 4 protein [Anaerolineales bacterium]